MAIAFRDQSTNAGQSVLNLAVAVPPLAAADDWLLELACTSTGQTITNPTTAVALTGSPVTGGSELAYGWSKKAVGGDLSTSVTFALSALAKIAGAIAAWSGVDPTTAIHQIASVAEPGTTLAHQMPAVTTTIAGCTIVYVIEAKDATTGVTSVLTPPSGSSLRASKFSGGTSQQFLGIADQAGAPTGTYGGAGFTFTSNAAGTGQGSAVMWTIALKPAATITTQISRPTSVVTAGSYTASPALVAGETLAARIGEAVRDDATYVQSPVNPTSQVFEWEETLLTDPGVGNRSGEYVEWVLSTAGGAASSTFVCEVRQQGNGTAIASWTKTSVPAAATHYQDTLSDAQIANINWSLPRRKRVTITVA